MIRLIHKHSTIHNYRLFCQKRNLKGHRKEGRLAQLFNPLLFQISNVFRLFQERGWSTVDSWFQVAVVQIKLQLSGWGRPKLSVAEGSTSDKCARWAGDGMVKWYSTFSWKSARPVKSTSVPSFCRAGLAYLCATWLLHFSNPMYTKQNKEQDIYS